MMGNYNDVIIEIKEEKKAVFESYLDSDDKERRLYRNGNVKPTSSHTYVYQWTGDSQLYITCWKTDFTIEDEMYRAGLEPEDYVAEMLTEDDEYEKCGKLCPTYLREMKARIWDGERYI